MVKKIVFAALVTIVTLTIYDGLTQFSYSHSVGAPIATCGSPGDGGIKYACTSCHHPVGNFTITATTKTGWVTSNIGTGGYIPGNTYTITATATRAGAQKFGFEISPQNSNSVVGFPPAPGKFQGTLTVTDPATTQLVLSLAPAISNKAITHTSDGTTPTTSGVKTWIFAWKAPGTGTGIVTFYGAFNAADGDGTVLGDSIYVSTLVIPEANSIATSTITGSSFCANQTGLSIPFIANGTYNAGNVFTAQLSDGEGSFTSPITIGTLTSISSGAIVSSIGLPSIAGTKYRIRVMASIPSVTGATNTTDLAINVPPTNSSAGPNQVICSGNLVTLNAAGGINYSWFPSSGLNTTTGASVLANPTTTTGYNLIVTDANGCNAIKTVTVTVQNSFNLNTGSSVTICLGAATILSVAGGTNYTWNPSSGLSSTTGINPIAHPAATTTYTVTSGCGRASVPVIVDAILPNAGSSQVICFGNSTTLNATGGINYLWAPFSGLSSTTGASVTASPTATTEYGLIVTDASGCTGISTVTVSVQNALTLNAGLAVTICAGSSTILNALGGSNYTWSPSSGLSSVAVINPIANPAATTTYSLTASAGACSVTPSEVTVSVVSLPTVNITGDLVFCQGSETNLTALGGDAFQWSTGANTQSILVSTESTLTVTGVDSNGCMNSAAATTTVSSLPIIAISGPTTVCDGSSVFLTESGASTYTWNPANTITANGTSVIASPTVNTTYSIKGETVTGCSDTTTFVLTVIDCSTGMEDYSISNSLNVFPNPTSDYINTYFTINASTGVVIRITDIQGRIVYTEVKNQFAGSYQSKIDLSKERKGVYLLQIIVDTETINKKVVVN